MSEQEQEVMPMEVETAEEESKKRERDEEKEETAPDKQEDSTPSKEAAPPAVNAIEDEAKVDMDDLKPAAKLDGNEGEKEESNDQNDEEEEDEEEDDTKPEAKEDDDDEEDEAGKENDEPKTTLPLRPIKRARTAYFIFADDKREEIKAKHPGEGVGVLAKATGQLWAALSEEDRAVYQDRSAQDRERVAQELAKYKLEGIEVPSSDNKVFDPHALIYPVARIRKICRLDPDVNGLSKEATMLITKCAELATTLLGQETVKVAQMQNRRKLLPEDVAQVCATRESFLFLREDVKDLVRDQKTNKSNGSGTEKARPAAATAAAANSKPLTSYFGAK